MVSFVRNPEAAGIIDCDAGDFIEAICVGCTVEAGSFLGGFLGSLLFGSGEPDASSAAGWIGSIVGALLLLLGYGMMTKRPTGP